MNGHHSFNLVEWGPGIYGAEAAARQYFHKPAAALTGGKSLPDSSLEGDGLAPHNKINRLDWQPGL